MRNKKYLVEHDEEENLQHWKMERNRLDNRFKNDYLKKIGTHWLGQGLR